MPTDLPMTDKTREELDYEAKIISDDLLKRIAKLEGANGKSWLYKNWFSIICVVGMIFTVGIGLGVVKQQQVSFEQRMLDNNQDWHASMVQFAAELAKDEARITRTEDDLNTHRRDQTRHVEPEWKTEVLKQLAELRALVVDILRNTRNQRAP